MTGSVTALLAALSSAFHQRGFDLMTPFSVRLVNERAKAGFELPLLGRADALGVIVGNSRALWKPFIDSLPDEPFRSADPLDSYVEESFERVLSVLGFPSGASPLRHWLGFSHSLTPRPLPMQKLADAAGLARLGPAHLNVHPLLGPWLALRAVVVFDLPPPAPLPAPAPSPCVGCSAPCRAALRDALAAQPSASAPPTALRELNASRRRFLRVRDVCPVGTSYRYGERQIAYHYATDPGALGPDWSGLDEPGPDWSGLDEPGTDEPGPDEPGPSAG